MHKSLFTSSISKTLLLFGLLLTLGGCASMTASAAGANTPQTSPAAASQPGARPLSTPRPTATFNPTLIGRNNGPAIQFCTDQGYQVQSQPGTNGSAAVELCAFPNGNHCEIWAFLNHQCSQAGSVNANRLSTPGAGETLQQAEDRVVHLLITSLVNDMDLGSYSSLSVVKIQPETWTDSCFDIPQSNQTCVPQKTSGFLVVLTDGQMDTTFHTDYSGLQVVRGLSQSHSGSASPTP